MTFLPTVWQIPSSYITLGLLVDISAIISADLLIFSQISSITEVVVNISSDFTQN